MSLTVKDEKLLKRLKKSWKYRYVTYIVFGVVAIKSMIALVNSVTNEDDSTILSEYLMLLMILVISYFFHYILRLYKIIEKMESVIREFNNRDNNGSID